LFVRLRIPLATAKGDPSRSVQRLRPQRRISRGGGERQQFSESLQPFARVSTQGQERIQSGRQPQRFLRPLSHRKPRQGSTEVVVLSFEPIEPLSLPRPPQV